jgi:hypothetical protein
MKIRSGFVSNSSSSSFCIYGTYMTFNEILEKVKSSLTEDEIEELEEDEYLLREMLEEKTSMTVYSSEGDYWIGRSWADIGDDETGSEFKESVKGELETILGPDIDCRTHEEEIYS